MAVFGGMCNVLSFVLNIYQNYYLQHHQDVWSFALILPAVLALAPLLVLFVFRHLWPVVFTYGLMLFLDLIWRVDYLEQYSRANPPFHKLDEPGLFLFLFGGISVVVVAVRAAIVFIRQVRSDMTRSP